MTIEEALAALPDGFFNWREAVPTDGGPVALHVNFIAPDGQMHTITLTGSLLDLLRAQLVAVCRETATRRPDPAADER